MNSAHFLLIASIFTLLAGCGGGGGSETPSESPIKTSTATAKENNDFVMQDSFEFTFNNASGESVSVAVSADGNEVYRLLEPIDNDGQAEKDITLAVGEQTITITWSRYEKVCTQSRKGIPSELSFDFTFLGFELVPEASVEEPGEGEEFGEEIPAIYSCK